MIIIRATGEVRSMLIDRIYEDFQKGRKSLALLLDPDEYDKAEIHSLFASGFDHVTYLFVGGSLLKDRHADSIISDLRKASNKPVVLFPGHASHISKNADAILFLSLLSGRNPEYLIGQQMISAPAIKKSGLEVLPTAYLLIEGGKPTTVQYMSNTFPIPADKPDIAACTALAGKYMGFKLVYLDAGSGAGFPVSQEMIHAVKEETELPLIVGGGIRSYEQMEKAYDAGADIVVIGNAIQNRELNLESLQAEKRR